jgi:hypothetical protein
MAVRAGSFAKISNCPKGIGINARGWEAVSAMAQNGYSNLEHLIQDRQFVVTGELGPPKGWQRSEVEKKVELVRGVVDAVNVTDNQTAIVRMSSIAAGRMLVEAGLEPIIQITCRDRNRLGMQSDLLGAAALQAITRASAIIRRPKTFSTSTAFNWSRWCPTCAPKASFSAAKPLTEAGRLFWWALPPIHLAIPSSFVLIG